MGLATGAWVGLSGVGGCDGKGRVCTDSYIIPSHIINHREAKSFTAEEKQVQASTVLLAALCVPPTPSEDGEGGAGPGGVSSADAMLNEGTWIIWSRVCTWVGDG